MQYASVELLRGCNKMIGIWIDFDESVVCSPEKATIYRQMWM